MLKLKDFIWKERKINNLSKYPLEEWYCIIDLGNGMAKKYSIKPQYPSNDGICIDYNEKPEYFIFFEANGALATEEDKKSISYKTKNFDGYLFGRETFIRVYTSLDDAKRRAFYNYNHIFGYCLTCIEDSLDKEINKHIVV